MEGPITKDALQNELYCGQQLAIQLLYTRYSGMLYGYVLQFVPDKLKAEGLLANIFSRLAFRLQEACDSSLSIYCWLQVEARKIILEYIQENKNAHSALSEPGSFNTISGQNKMIPMFAWKRVLGNIARFRQTSNKGKTSVVREPFPYPAMAGRHSRLVFLLEDASPEHQRVFRKLFLQGADKEKLALQEGKDLAYINRLLRESLLIIRKRLG